MTGWIQALDGDPRLLLRAGIEAQKAVALVLGMRQAQAERPPLYAKPSGTGGLTGPPPESRVQGSPEPAAFTAIDVIYRDGANYKQFESYVVQGTLTFEDLEPFLREGIHFVGRDVQMEDLAFRFVLRDGMDLNEGDQPWQAVEAVGPTTPELAAEAEAQGRFLGKASDVLERFKRASRLGWPGCDEAAQEMVQYMGLDPQAVQNEDERQNRSIGY